MLQRRVKQEQEWAAEPQAGPCSRSSVVLTIPVGALGGGCAWEHMCIHACAVHVCALCVHTCWGLRYEREPHVNMSIGRRASHNMS